MKTIFGLTIKSATRDLFLLLWSLIIPIGGSIALGFFIKSPEYPQRVVIGMMAASVLFYTFITAAYTIMGQRKRGVYSLLRVTPMQLWKYVFSVSSAWTLIAAFCGMLVIIVCVPIFKLAISISSIAAIIPVILIAAVGFVFFSFFISSLVRTESHMSMITNLIAMPMLFCSDAFYSLDNAPAFLQMISRFNPFQWFINGLRNALSLDVNGYLISIGLLLVLLIVALLLALRTFRYTDK